MSGGRPPSPGQSAVMRAAAEAEKERYGSLSTERRRSLVQTRDREAQQAADRRRTARSGRRASKNPPDPAKVTARAYVQLAVQNGTLVKPAACQNCGRKTSKLEAHHPDHSKPKQVQWRCATCHGKTQQAGSLAEHPHGQKGPVA